MTKSKLKQLLTIFEAASAPLALAQVARDLEVSPERLEAMIQYWVRKGRIKESQFFAECGTCGLGESCPFVLEMPRSYELAGSGHKGKNAILPLLSNQCGRWETIKRKK